MLAEDIGITIDTFDVGRGSIKGGFIVSGGDCMASILATMGYSSGLHEVARDYYRSRHEKNTYEEGELLQVVLEELLTNLRHEYEYLTGEEYVIEGIEANDYMFYEDGTLHSEYDDGGNEC